MGNIILQNLEGTLSLPTTINGELGAFWSANRDNIHCNNNKYQLKDDDNDDAVEINDDYDDNDNTYLSKDDDDDDDNDDKINDYFKVTESMSGSRQSIDLTLSKTYLHYH